MTKLDKIGGLSVAGFYLSYVLFLIMGWVDHSVGLPMETLFKSFDKFPASCILLSCGVVFILIGFMCCVFALINKIKGFGARR